MLTLLKNVVKVISILTSFAPTLFQLFRIVTKL
jgi:hypothetical protein